MLAFTKVVFFVYLQVDDQRTQSHTTTDAASAVTTGADPITQIHATFILSVFSSLKESGNKGKLCGGRGVSIHQCNALTVFMQQAVSFTVMFNQL